MNNNEFFEEGGSFVVNLDKISKHKSLSRITRVLAIDLQENPYLTLGQFYRSLSNQEVDDLSKLCERTDDDAVSEVLLLTEMLARAEGIASTDIDDMSEKVNAFVVMTAGVGLTRKGLVKAYYDNMTLDLHANKNKVIFVKKKNVDPGDILD